MISVQEGAFEESSEQDEIRRTNVLADRIEKIEGREDVLRRNLKLRKGGGRR